MRLQEQAHYGKEGWDGSFDRDRAATPGSTVKPDGAFWTTTIRDDGSTDWAEWAEIEGYPLGQTVYSFAVTSEPRLLILRRDTDLRIAIMRAGLWDAARDYDLNDWFSDRKRANLFWDWVRASYDAVHVPEDFDRCSVLNRWDCESTAWLRPQEHLRYVDSFVYKEGPSPRP